MITYEKVLIVIFLVVAVAIIVIIFLVAAMAMVVALQLRGWGVY